MLFCKNIYAELGCVKTIFWGNVGRREKNRLPAHSGSHFIKHLMKPVNPFRFTGTPPASGLSGLPISPLRISIYNVSR
jgi:hypothetical protein